MPTVFPDTWRDVIALDTETYGGLDPRNERQPDAPWACAYSIFLARLDAEGRMAETQQIWVNPAELPEKHHMPSVAVTANLCAGRQAYATMPKDCPFHAAALAQYEWLKTNGVTVEQARKHVADFVGENPAGYLGSNVGKFDLDTVFRNMGIVVPVAPVLDTKAMWEAVAGLLPGHDLPRNRGGYLSGSLALIGEILGVGNDEPHTAAGDTEQAVEAAITLKRFYRLMQRAFPVRDDPVQEGMFGKP